MPLVDLDTALEQTLFQSGLSREALLKRLIADVQQPGLLPLLWLLPRRWKLAPAQLPTRLQQLAGILERGLLSPLLLAALADDMPNLRLGDGRVVADGPARNSMQLWRREAISDGNLPTSLGAWLAHGAPNDAPPESSQRPAHTSPQSSQLAAGLLWCNVGLEAPSQGQQKLNRFTAQILNRLGANLIAGHPIAQDPWLMEGCCSARQWVGLLLHQGWRIKAQLRASVASFGLGASMTITGQGWVQVPLALPMRTGMLDTEGQEQQALLPHSCLELAMSHGGQSILLQYYQGTEGLCGWEALNDLERPWQNNRQNGTVRYLGEPFEGEQLLQVLDFCDWMSLVHNQQSSAMQLPYGGYGSLGFCIDTSALIQQAMTARCDLFPVLLGGVWRERLRRCSQDLHARASQTLGPGHHQAAEQYAQALMQIPSDLSLQGQQTISEARRRLKSCQPSSSPFRLVQQWNVPST